MYSKKSPRVMKPWMGLPKSLNVIQPGQTSANLPITASRQHSYRPLADGTLVLLAEVGHKPPPIPLEEIQLPLEQTPFNPGSVIGKRPWIEHHRDDDEEVAEDGHSVKRARIIFDDGDDDDDDDDTDEEEVEDEDKDADGEEDEDADGEEDEDANANAGRKTRKTRTRTRSLMTMTMVMTRGPPEKTFFSPILFCELHRYVASSQKSI